MPAALRRLTGGPYSPWFLDVTIALAQTAVSLQLGLNAPPPQWPPLDGAGIALTCAVNLLPMVRRRRPVAVMVLVCAGWAWYVALGYWPVVNSLAPMLMLYTVASLRPPRRAAGAAALLSGVWTFSAARDPHAVLTTAVAQALVFSGTLWKFGDSARKLALSNLALADTAERLRLEQEDRARAAVARERARIARELHDVVAHHLTVVSVQAGLARYVLATDRETAGRALDTVLSSSSEALEELRRVLFLFRAAPAESDPPAGPDAPAGPYAPTAGLRELPALVDRVRSAGVDLALQVDGAPYPLGPGADLCAYRVVQESLTNILKHAPGSRASITVGYGAEQLTVRVRNETSAGAPGAGTGNGLLGMRERARVYGGALHAGADPQGGFNVLLTLPAAGVTARHPGQSPDS